MLSVLTKSEKEEQSAAPATATDTDGEANQCAKGVKLCMLLMLLTVSCGLLLLLQCIFRGSQSFKVPPIISGTGNAMDFKFGWYIQRVHPNN